MIIQILIVLTGGVAIWMVNQDKNWAKWGNVVGLVSQPLWLYTTFVAEQWGIFALSLFYMFCWGQGVYNKFYKRPTLTQKLVSSQ